MARACSTDFLHNMRFHVVVLGSNTDGYLIRPDVVGTAVAGFTNVSVPGLNVEPVEYREGHFIYARKYPGMPSVDNVTMSRGVAARDSSFWSWVLHAVEGNQTGVEYRIDFDIMHYHRKTLYSAQTGVQEFSNLPDMQAARIYHCKNAVPVKCKPAADLDANSADISIQELEAAIEYMALEEFDIS